MEPKHVHKYSSASIATMNIYKHGAGPVGILQLKIVVRDLEITKICHE